MEDMIETMDAITITEEETAEIAETEEALRSETIQVLPKQLAILDYMLATFKKILPIMSLE